MAISEYPDHKLGICVHCLGQGRRLPAVTMFEGTALCENHGMDHVHDARDVPVHERQEARNRLATG